MKGQIRAVVNNGLVAATYVAIGIGLPSTGITNLRLSTALYLLAAYDRRLVLGLAFGNALTGLIQNGALDGAGGLLVGLITAWACSRMPDWLGPVAIAILPTVIVPAWLQVIAGAPYSVVLPAVLVGQIVSAVIAWVLVLPAGRRLFKR